jgi:hypothetical protein
VDSPRPGQVFSAPAGPCVSSWGRADQGEAAQSPGVPAVGPRGAAISRHPGLSSIGLSPARQVSIAGMTQPISAQAIGPPGPTHLEVVMRMLLKAVLDTKAANEAFRSGAAAEALDQIQEALQPEALYGFVEEGERVFFAVFDLADASEIPVISEPLFQRANVKITLTPCMTLEDAKKGIEEAARRMADLQR